MIFKMMIATVTNFGDSFGVQIPKSLLKNSNFFENDDVEVLIKNDSIIITQRKGKKHLTTKERISAFGRKIDDVLFPETDWGKPQGKEIW